MCRNITGLRGLEPPATQAEIEAAALQFVRKVMGIQKPPVGFEDRVAEAVQGIADITTALLTDLPPRRQPPATLPPLRRLAHAHPHPHPHD
jgi:hypothetical protein